MSALPIPSALLISGALLFGGATEAQAQVFDISFGKHRGHKQFDLRIGSDRGRHEHRHGRHDHRRPRVIRERVWIPGRCERVWREPIYQIRYDACGQPRRVCVRQGFYETIQYPGRYEYRERRGHRSGRDYGGRRGRRGSNRY